MDDVRIKTKKLLRMLINSPSRVKDSKSLVDFGESKINGAFEELLLELDQYMTQEQKQDFMNYLTDKWDLAESLSNSLEEFVSDYDTEPQRVFEELNHYWNTEQKDEFMDHVQLLRNIE